MANQVRPSLTYRVKRLLRETRAGRLALVGPRTGQALLQARIVPQIVQVLRWGVRSREIANFTYETTRESELLLVQVVAAMTGRPVGEVMGYLAELAADHELHAHVGRAAQEPANRWSHDPGFKPGRRLAAYLIARALKPAEVVEAGVDKGLGAVLLSRALVLNSAEGRPGRYLGIELDPHKSIDLYESLPDRQGQIVRGNSLDVLRGRTEPIDLFIHDTTAEPAHLTTQLDAVAPLMAPQGVLVSTWTTPELIAHAFERNLRLLTHQEETVDHWFPGDRVAFLSGYGLADGGRSL